MTEENFQYRTSQQTLRNQFGGKGKHHMPTIPKATFTREDFEALLLLGFDKTKLEDNSHLDRMVHFFLYDYKFERVWKEPDRDIEKLRRYRAVLSPDFSMYLEMHPLMQLYNVFRNRWCGAYFASKGMRVIPTVSWGDESTFDFCFEGIEKGSAVAVSTYMVSEHGSHRDQKEFFMKGYRELLRRIEPETVICYNMPFPEMEGNIVFVDYNESSWRYMWDDPRYAPSKYVKYILGIEPKPADCAIIIKRTGYVIKEEPVEKGMGSAYGGSWRPKNKESERFLGIPGEIKSTTMQNGSVFLTKIGDDGRAVMERHLTDHNKSYAHTIPHDHIVQWDPRDGHPIPGKPINYWQQEYPKGIPEFKLYQEVKTMNSINAESSNRFESISEFKFSVEVGTEVGFRFGSREYFIYYNNARLCIADLAYEDSDFYCDTFNDLLEYRMGNTRLGDVVKEIEITERFL